MMEEKEEKTNVMCVICGRVRIGANWTNVKADEKEKTRLPMVPCPTCRPPMQL